MNASRIAAVNTRILGSHTTGTQRYLLELLSRWQDAVTFIEPQRPRHGIKGHAWEQMALPAKIRKGMPLFSPSNTGPLAVANQVVTIHDVVPLDHPEWLNPRFAKWYRFLTPRLAHRVRHIITISEFTRQRIQYHMQVPREKISVIPNGVDARFNLQASSSRESLHATLGLPYRNYVLYVGSLEPRKNLKGLIEAWRRLQDHLPDDLGLVICGAKGPSRIYAEQDDEAALPPRVHFTGHVPDHLMPVLYARAEFFVYPSVYEGFGLPPLEAMACGVPVITGNRTALPEVVGDAAYQIDPGDTDAIAEAILRLADDTDLRQDLALAGMKRSYAFSWETTARKTLDVITGTAWAHQGSVESYPVQPL